MTGPRILPNTSARPAPAAAMVLHLTKPVPLEPIYQQLDAHPGVRGIAGMRLVPVVVRDFYANPAHEGAR